MKVTTSRAYKIVIGSQRDSNNTPDFTDNAYPHRTQGFSAICKFCSMIRYALEHLYQLVVPFLYNCALFGTAGTLMVATQQAHRCYFFENPLGSDRIKHIVCCTRVA